MDIDFGSITYILSSIAFFLSSHISLHGCSEVLFFGLNRNISNYTRHSVFSVCPSRFCHPRNSSHQRKIIMSIGLLTSTIQAAKRIRDRAEPVVQNFGSGVASLVQQGDDFSYLGKKKSLLDFIRLSAVVCGIEFCYAAETAFVSPILLKLGVPAAFMSLVWCLSPVLGILLVPLLGSLSDHCKLKIGRRRPFIIFLATGIVLGLIIVPNGKMLGKLMGDQIDDDFNKDSNATSNISLRSTVNFEGKLNLSNSSFKKSDLYQTKNDSEMSQYHEDHTKGIVVTIIGVVLLDFSCDAAQSPSRAYLLDVSIPEDHSRGLSTFSIMAGLGGCVGYVLGGINWDLKHAKGWSLEQHVMVVFSAVTVFFIICLFITLTSFKEISLHEQSAEDLQKSTKTMKKAKYSKFTNEGDEYEHDQREEGNIHTSDSVHYGSTDGSNTSEPRTKTNQSGTEEQEITAQQPSLQNSNLASLLNEVKLKTYFVSIIRMPRSLFILCLTNLFCWMALICYSLYFTDFVGQAVYGGDPKAPKLSHLHQLYNDGVRLGSFGMALYSLSCAVYAMFVEGLVEKFGAKKVYIGGQLVYTVGMVIMAATLSPVTVILLSPTAGVMYATLFTLPYMIVANYHNKEQFSLENLSEENKIRGLGTDVAIVSSMVFVAQFVLSTFVGSVVDATGSTVAVVFLAALFSFLGSLSATQVLYLDL